MTTQAPPRPSKPVFLPAGARKLALAPPVYTKIDLASLPRFQSRSSAFVPYEKTIYASLQSPLPTGSVASEAELEGVFSYYDFSAERKKHAAFEVLSARVKQLVGDKAIVCKAAPPADELDKIFIWCDSPDHYQVRLRNQSQALELENLNDLAAAIEKVQKQ